MDSFITKSFNKNERITILETQSALKKYTDEIGKAQNLDSSLPIVLDTNVLLKFYRISFHEREQLKSFLEQNKNRIYITPQIEKEFLRNRNTCIEGFLKSLNDLAKRFNAVLSNIKAITDGANNVFSDVINNKIIKEDNETLYSELLAVTEEFSRRLKSLFGDDLYSRLTEKFNSAIETISLVKNQADIDKQDELLEIVSQFKVVGELNLEDKQLVIEKYKKLKQEFDSIPEKDKFNILSHAFPGKGEDKDGDKEGDFIIYHEILKFITDQDIKTNVIFLTDDITKEDWLHQIPGKVEYIPFTHYIINDYICTGQVVYIFPATDKLRISYDTIYSETEEKEQPNEIQEVCLEEVPHSKETPSEDTLEYDSSEQINYQTINKYIISSLFRNKIIESTGQESAQISTEKFISELQVSENWASTYGAGFVGKDYFIYKILKNKGYKPQDSLQVLKTLISDDKVGEYIYQEADKREIEAIRLNK